MLYPALVLAITVLAQGGSADTFFRENEEAVVYTYRVEVEREGRICRLPVAASFAAFVELSESGLCRGSPALRGVGKSGRCLLGRERDPVSGGPRGGMSVGPIIRTAQEIRLLNGPQKGKSGWIVASHLRRYARIRVEPPERYTDETRTHPAPWPSRTKPRTR